MHHTSKWQPSCTASQQAAGGRTGRWDRSLARNWPDDATIKLGLDSFLFLSLVYTCAGAANWVGRRVCHGPPGIPCGSAPDITNLATGQREQASKAWKLTQRFKSLIACIHVICVTAGDTCSYYSPLERCAILLTVCERIHDTYARACICLI